MLHSRSETAPTGTKDEQRFEFGTDLCLLSSVFCQPSIAFGSAADPTFVNEDGTPVRLRLDKVRSVSFGLKVTLLLKADEIAVRKAGEKTQQGTWESFGENIVAEFENDGARELEKMYFTWDEKDLLLRRSFIS